MKLYSILLINKRQSKILEEAYNLSEYNFIIQFQVKRLIRAAILDIMDNMDEKDSGVESVDEKIYDFKVNITLKFIDNLLGVIISDIDYSNTCKIQLFKELFSRNSHIKKIMNEYKEDKSEKLADEINKELDIAEYNAKDGIRKILKRGRTLEQITMDSERLSLASKKLFMEAKKKNAWCCFR
ncbi:hypothetical protein A0H76_1940 [Hepatospora eriocheir]|uniref:V-SNARE coiled-coil homology domain-containing protein n=1 Tax=Hepatospora eriocheir TaxID=1081669 RepID=A0A1X0QG94_9MICR|nr:hypothetical protein A0H76_1940 [Hepatospora eriocheir]